MIKTRNETLDMYFIDLRSTILLPEHEIRALILTAQTAGDQEATAARNRVIEGNLRLVVKLAKRYEKHAPKEDLVAEGNLGLFTAVDRFDLNARNREGGFIRFTTYASWWIRNSMSRLVGEPPYTGQVHVPNYLVRLATMDERQLDQRKVAASTRLFLPFVRASLNSVGLVDRAGTDDEPWDVEDRRAAEPADEVADREHLMSLAGSLERLVKAANLTDRESSVLHDTVQLKATLRELAAKMDISKERVRQIKLTAVAKLRRAAARIGFRGYSHAEGQE